MALTIHHVSSLYRGRSPLSLAMAQMVGLTYALTLQRGSAGYFIPSSHAGTCTASVIGPPRGDGSAGTHLAGPVLTKLSHSSSTPLSPLPPTCLHLSRLPS